MLPDPVMDLLSSQVFGGSLPQAFPHAPFTVAVEVPVVRRSDRGSMLVAAPCVQEPAGATVKICICAVRTESPWATVPGPNEICSGGGSALFAQAGAEDIEAHDGATGHDSDPSGQPAPVLSQMLMSFGLVGLITELTVNEVVGGPPAGP